MATETTRVSSYFRAEGYYDSAGNLLSTSLSGINNVMSGICASAQASQINNVFSGLSSTVTAGMLLSAPAATTALGASTAVRATTADAATSATTAARATTADAAASASYAASAPFITGISAVSAGNMNVMIYGSALRKMVVSSTTVTGTVNVSPGLIATGGTIFFFATPQVSAYCYATVTNSTGTTVTITLLSSGAAATGVVCWIAMT